jgi:hypothetical protein
MEHSHLWKKLLEINTGATAICVPYGEEYKRIKYRTRNIERLLALMSSKELAIYCNLVKSHACRRDYDAALDCIKTTYIRLLEMLGLDLITSIDRDDSDEYEGLLRKLDKLINSIDIALRETNEWDMDSVFFNNGSDSIFFYESALSDSIVNYIEINE